MNIIEKISSFFGKFMAVIVLAVTVLALFVPSSCLWIQTSWINWLLMIVMFGMGLTLKLSDFAVVFSRPRDVLIGCVAQFTIMPLLAFALGKIFNLPAELLAGVVLVGTCPGGTSSNVITYLSKGDVPLSVGMTSVNTLLAPVLTPAITYLLLKTSVEVNVLQGEREFAKDNKQLGVFHLDGILPARRGTPQIEVTFDIDANGIVHVSAKDLGTGKEQHIQITSSSGLSDAEIEKMVKDAEANAAADKAKRESVDAKNEADSLIYATEKSIKDLGDKVDAAEKQKVEDAVAALKQALQSDNVEDIKAKTEALKQASYKIAEELYKQQGAAGAQPGADAGAQPGPDAGANTNSGSSSGFDKGSADDVEFEVHDDK